MSFVAVAVGVGAAVAGVAGSAISAHAAGEAAKKQSNAANYAADLQKQEADNALAFQKQEWQTQQNNLAPWLQSGTASLANLNAMMPQFESGLATPFVAPTGATEANDPGYQFRMQQGEGALENSAAARGGLLSGNTLEAMQQYGQNYASNEYGNVYNRAVNQYGLNRQNILDRYNMLAGMSGVGQTAATTLGNEGQTAASNIGNIMLTSGAQQGQDIQNAAAAQASGYVGGANAWSSGLSGTANNLMNLYLMQNMFGSGGGGGLTSADAVGMTPSMGG